MKQDKPPFNDIRVRRAVALSIDRVGWVKGPLGGFGLPFGGNLAYGTEYWIPDDGYGDASQWLEYDPERAVALLAEAGYGPGDIDVTMESTPDYGERFAAEAEVSAGFLNEIGIKTTLEMVDYDSFVPVWRDGKFKDTVYTWSQTGTIPEEWLFTPFHSTRRGTKFWGIVDPPAGCHARCFEHLLRPRGEDQVHSAGGNPGHRPGLQPSRRLLDLLLRPEPPDSELHLPRLV